MRKVAANKVYFSQSEYKINQIVEINNCNVVNVRDLKQEESMTEWMAGAIILTNKTDINPENIKYISDFYSSTQICKPNIIYAWHVEDLEYDTGRILNKNISHIK